jgi:outer membrane lipoprotein-sorting protein
MNMLRLRALALMAAPLALAAAVTPAALGAQAAPTGLAQVQAHLRAVQTMTANFTQTNRGGRSLGGTLIIRRPGHVRFDYGSSANMLIVGDGNALIFIDYDVGQRQRWPINDSPLTALLNPNEDLSRVAHVVQDDAQVLMIEASDSRRREFGTITIAFAKVAGAPGGLSLQGWNTRDAQNNLTTIRLSNQRFNVPVADAAFRYREPVRHGPRG